MHTPHTVAVTEFDLERLQRVLDLHGDTSHPESVEALEWKLSKALVTHPEAAPASLVTMNSTVLFEDEGKGEFQQVTLSYPKDAQGAPGRVSVLAPVGVALLGLSAGQRVELEVPGGRKRRLRVVAVPYQPEAAGHFHL
ncbi:nucleoside diphosphate kinase regulator [Pyxidicoccus parkwayensis]|uniref:Nucleoside diphosphate kinase regulator n=1 Tax=Pyxidicoccus parkwayensis TaxID=2813578 RepID=A0ABX7NQA3_9BACT|nr:nucleoside diphosphate kinase regulator [Pyxidicoccus parkwaysis]QSQ19702.1 nucleoside diphosphate kinase regulator [Pyxidicoccus parkwaysis]